MYRVIYKIMKRVFIHDDKTNDITEFDMDEAILLSEFVAVDTIRRGLIGLGVMVVTRKQKVGNVCDFTTSVRKISNYELEELLCSDKLLLKEHDFQDIASPVHVLSTKSTVLVSDKGTLLYGALFSNQGSIILSKICRRVEMFSHLRVVDNSTLVLDGRIEKFDLHNYAGHLSIVCRSDCRPEICGYLAGIASENYHISVSFGG